MNASIFYDESQRPQETQLVAERLFAYLPASLAGGSYWCLRPMPFQPTVRRLLWLAFCGCAGCALPADGKKPVEAFQPESNVPAGGGAAPSNAPPSASTAAPPVAGPTTAPPSAAGATAQTRATGATQTGAAPDPRVLDDVLAELATLGPMQPEAQQRLIDDLRKTDPAYWPMLVKTFRASLAYRRRAAERASTAKNPLPETPEDAPRQSDVIPVAATEPIHEAGPGATPAATVLETTGDAPSQPATSSNPLPNQPIESQCTDSTVGRPSRPSGAKDGIEGRPTDALSPPSPGSRVPSEAGGVEWRRHIEAAISELEQRNRQQPNDPEALANEIYLRLLDLAAGRRDDALRPIPGIPPAQQDYWAKQLFALSAYLDPRNTDSSRRAAEAGLHLSRAIASLCEQAPLVVRNLAFCTDVHSYGVLKRFEPAEFRPGQQVLLYAEVENFKSDETAQGFHTSLEATYQILDGQGRRVAHDDLPLTEEDCQNHRRDFFVSYLLHLPKAIYEGSYTLQLTIEDKLAHKIGQSKITFNVKEKK